MTIESNNRPEENQPNGQIERKPPCIETTSLSDRSKDNFKMTADNADEDKIDGSTRAAGGLPIDRGWAWVVLAGMTFYLILFGGIRKNFGLFFVAFQSRFNSSASLTSLLTTMQSLVTSFSSLFVMTIGMHYISNRTSIMIGGILITISNIINAWATDIRFLFVSFGIFEGLGIAMVHPPQNAILAEYFNKRRALASGLAYSGASFGGLVFAPIMTSLFQSQGYTGTLMIVAGMTLNIVVSGALMRPIKSFEKVHTLKHDGADQNRKFKAANRNTSVDTSNHDFIQQSENIKEKTELVISEDNTNSSNHSLMFNKLNADNTEDVSKITPIVNNKAILKLKVEKYANPMVPKFESYETEMSPTVKKDVISPLLPRFRAWSVDNAESRPRTESQSSQKSLSPLTNVVDALSRSRIALYGSTTGGFIEGSVIDVREFGIADTQDQNIDMGQKQISCCAKFKKSASANLKRMFDTTLFRNRVFPMFMLMGVMYAPANGLTSICLAPHAKDVGLTQEQIGILLTIVGATGLFTRITAAMFADRKFVKLTTLLALPAFVIGVASHCMRFFTSFHSLIVFAVLVGLTCELYHCMYAVILVEYLTLTKLRSAIGFNLLFNGVAMAVTFPVIGSLRDVTGNYIASYHLLGTMSIVGGCVALAVPYVNKRNTTILEKYVNKE